MNRQSHNQGITFGLIFFASSETTHDHDKYRLVIESTKYADSHDFSSVWIPERHFTRDGWLYPNPAILQAALARETKQIQLRAGSVVLPLHNPLRVAEEWAMVDNLSGGRVGLSIASGWHPNDFALFPDHYERRNEVMYEGIETVRKLWRGESVQVKGGDGKMVEIRTYPTPIQPEVPIWVTAAGNPKTFAKAGEIGANLLTHMYNQSVEELGEKIKIYRDARAAHGYDPQTGQVSVMLHTFIAESEQAVSDLAKGPFCDYLRSAAYLLNAVAYSRGQKVDLATLSEEDVNEYLSFVFERMVSTQRVLFGTPESCLPLVRQLRAVGVNEIACQLDFGIETDVVMASMPHLNRLRELSDEEGPQGPEPEHNSYTLQSFTPSTSAQSNGHALNGSSQQNGQPGVAHAEANDESLQSVQQRCQEEVALDAFYQRLEQHGIELNEDYRSIRQLWRRDGEALGRVSLVPAFERERERYQVHPTMLDSCLQVLTSALPQSLGAGEGGLYLPVGLQSFKLHERPGKVVWSHATLDQQIRLDATTLEGHVRIFSEDGRLLIEAKGIQLQRSAPLAPPVPTVDLSSWLYELRWEKQGFIVGEQTNSPEERSGTWLIFADRQGVGQRLAQRLQTRGQECALVQAGSHYGELGSGRYQVSPTQLSDVQRVISRVQESFAAPLRGVVHLWSLDSTPSEQTTAQTLEHDLALSTTSALGVMQSLAQNTTAHLPRLWLVTRDAQAVTADNAALAVAQSPLWGLGRTCAMEHPEIWGALVDLSSQGSIEEATQQLYASLLDTSREDQVAFRQGERYVARMVRSHDFVARDLHIRAQGSYLVTGGLWGLGFEVARWLAQKGARSLILAGRTQVPPSSEWERIPATDRLASLVRGIRELEAEGVTVHCVQLDVTDEAQLRTFLADHMRQGHPPIKGILHAASVWQDAQGQPLVKPLVNLDAPALDAVFRPKVIGSWLLHTLFQESRLDFFVSFSSGASLFGSAAQGNYAAAGAFMDSLAHYQRAQGLPAISIDWGAVSEIGFGATAEGQRVHEYWESHGIQRITPRDVLAALELLIPQQAAQVGVLKLDWQLLREFYPQIAALPLVSYLVEDTNEQAKQQVPTTAGNGIDVIQRATGSERLSLLEQYLSEQVAAVLRVPAERLDIEQPLTTLGLDSLMAIELKNRIEQALGVRVPIVTFLQGPSIAQFASQLLEQLPTVIEVAVEAPSQSEEALNQDQAQQLLDQLDELSDHDVDALLQQMLAGQGEQPTAAQVQDTGKMSPQEAAELLSQLDQLPEDEIDSLLKQMVQGEE